MNRNKRSLTLNMASKPGQEILAALLKKSDVLVENFKVGTLEKWGITNEWLEANAPQVIRASITGYGANGPKGGLPGYDFILQAESGLMSITGPVDGVPTKHGVALVDVCTGMLASNAILAALNARNQTGRGQHLEMSLYESSLFMLANVAANYLACGREGGRFGNGHPSIVPYTTYPTRDGMMAVAVGNDVQLAKFAAAVGHAEWGRDARFVKNKDRVAHREALDGLIADTLRQDDAAAWVEKLKAAGVPCGRINSVVAAGRGAAEAAQAQLPLTHYLRQPAILATALAFFGYAYILYFFLSWFPSYLTMAMHLSIQKMAIVSVIPWALGFVGLASGGFVCDALGRRLGDQVAARKLVMVVCLLVAAVTVAPAGIASSLEAVITLIAIAVFFMYLSGSTYWAIILGLVESGRVGGVAGFVHLIANTAGIVAPIVTGVLVEKTGSFASAFVLAGGLAIVGALLVALLVRGPSSRPVALAQASQR